VRTGLLIYTVYLVYNFYQIIQNQKEAIEAFNRETRESLAAFESHMALADADSDGVATLEEQFRYFSDRFNASHIDTSRTRNGHRYETLSTPCIIDGRRGNYPATIRGGPAILFPAPSGSYNKPKDFKPKEHEITYRR